MVEKMKEGASTELNTASDMVKDLRGKTEETAQNLKEVEIEATKAVKKVRLAASNKPPAVSGEATRQSLLEQLPVEANARGHSNHY